MKSINTDANQNPHAENIMQTTFNPHIYDSVIPQ